ncbi:MAG TPA: DEAD/DEAH box helicase, partial [Polyangiaceae bacterium]
IKNGDTLRAKAAYGIKAKTRIIATGTPIENHPSDLFSLFHFLNPHLLGSTQRFQRRFGRAAESGDELATRQRKDLRRVIRPFILRRTKAQVLDDLPPLTEIRHTVNLSPAETALYESLRKRALKKLENTTKNPQLRVQILAELMRLRRLCCHPSLVAPEANLESAKLAAFMELVDELLANQHRALVFSQFVDFLALARKMLDARGIRYQYLDGATPQKQRTVSVDAFQSGEGDLFLISLKAGGFGLNLTGADYVIHLDPWWNPATEQQASDRAHRIGQTRPVTVYRLVTAGTIEERIVELHHRKREVANSLLEGAEGASNISQDELLDLLSEG